MLVDSLSRWLARSEGQAQIFDGQGVTNVSQIGVENGAWPCLVNTFDCRACFQGPPMADTIEKIKIVNSSIRTGLVAVFTAALGYSGCVGYNQFIRPGQEAQQKYIKLQEEYVKQTEELTTTKKLNDKLQTSLKLLKIDRRIANIAVVDQGKSPDGEPFMDVEYSEVSQSGAPIGDRRRFHLRGERLYVDCWVVQFEDEYVENADPLRHASLCVMKSIWGDLDGPNGGFPLDRAAETDVVPVIYQDTSESSSFERKIWEDFWSVSNDPLKQKELGIRASHGQVNYMRVETGKTYQVEVRASGGTTISPLSR